jgi:hypothetical protein
MLLGATLFATVFGVGAGVFFTTHEYVPMLVCLGLIVANWLTVRHKLRHPK